jgi:hypothetical protein
MEDVATIQCSWVIFHSLSCVVVVVNCEGKSAFILGMAQHNSTSKKKKKKKTAKSTFAYGL